MEHMVKPVENQTLLEDYRLLLETVERLPLQVRGSSMAPFLGDRRDTVYVSKPHRPLRVGDIVLYRRAQGVYILHRICRLENGTFWLVGDAQTTIERNVAPEQIFALVRSAVRKGRRQAPGCFWWEFFEKVWVRAVPLRPAALKLYRLFRRR